MSLISFTGLIVFVSISLGQDEQSVGTPSGGSMQGVGVTTGAGGMSENAVSSTLHS